MDFQLAWCMCSYVAIVLCLTVGWCVVESDGANFVWILSVYDDEWLESDYHLIPVQRPQSHKRIKPRSTNPARSLALQKKTANNTSAQNELRRQISFAHKSKMFSSYSNHKSDDCTCSIIGSYLMGMLRMSGNRLRRTRFHCSTCWASNLWSKKSLFKWLANKTDIIWGGQSSEDSNN